jgi:hypothetical protein
MTTNDSCKCTDRDSPDARRLSEERWDALPEVLRAAFDCSKHVSMVDALQTLGVDNTGAAATVQCVYESVRGPLVMPVWHYHIERDADGSLAYWIDAFGWRPEGEGPQGDRNAETRRLLAQNAGHDVYVLLLKRGWNDSGKPVVAASAPDIVMWRLESAGQQWYVLRRPRVQRSDGRRGRGHE